MSAFFPEEWARCELEGGLCGDGKYEACRAENSQWIPIQTTGDLGFVRQVGNKKNSRVEEVTWLAAPRQSLGDAICALTRIFKF